MYKITLSMPIYNVEKYIERALLSALNQTYPDIDYLIVDDKGTDRSMDIVRNIIAIHPRGKNVRITEHPENLGIGTARNTAIEQARGEYFFFLDSDDEITPDCLQKLYDEIQRTNADVISGSYDTITEKEVIRSISKVFLSDREQIVLTYFDRNFPVVVWNKLYRMSFLRDNRIRCIHRLMEDNYFTLHVLLKASSYSVIPDITYHRYIRGDSITGKEWNKTVCMTLPQVLIDCHKLLQNSHLDDALRIKIKKKLFKRRFGLAKLAWESPYPVQHYINDYLSPLFFKDKDTFRSLFLLAGYLFSMMPLPVKKALIRGYGIVEH